MADVEVSLERAVDGQLPLVCVMTGVRADGRVPIPLDRTWLRWRSQTVRLPMSKPAFRKWLLRNSLMLRSRTLAILLVAGSLVLSAKNPLIALLLLVVAGATMALSVWAERGLPALQPELVRKKGNLCLNGVHEAFADAVRQSG